jgi:hypothetical protein
VRHARCSATNLTNSTTYYFRFRYEYVAKTGREAYVGPWSQTDSYTTAAISVPAAGSLPTGCDPVKLRWPTNPPANTAADRGHRVGDTTANHALSMWGNIDLGQEHATRSIHVGVGMVSTIDIQSCYVLTEKQIAAGDLIGTALTRDATTASTNSRIVALYSGIVASGRWGWVYSTQSTSNATVGSAIGACVAKAYNMSSLTPILTRTNTANGGGDPFNIGATFDITAGQVAIAVGYSTQTYASRSWGGSFTELSAAAVTAGNVSPGVAFITMGARVSTGTAIQAAFSGRSGGVTHGALAEYA